MSSSHSPRKVRHVGSRIRELRKGRRLTQTELSEKIGVAQSDLSRMEQGEYKVGLDTLFKILQAFDPKIAAFFGDFALKRGGVLGEPGRPTRLPRASSSRTLRLCLPKPSGKFGTSSASR